MSDKRAEKKKLYMNRIIDAANKIFTEYGYKNSTMELIAKEANVGVGTTYLYFKSKSELFKKTMKKNLRIEYLSTIAKEVDYDTPVADCIYSMLINVFDNLKSIDKEFFKDFYLALLQDISSNERAIHDLFKFLDDEIIDQIKTVLNNYKNKGRLVDNFDVDACAEIFLCNIVSGYIFLNTIAEERFLQTIRSKIEFVIKPYMV